MTTTNAWHDFSEDLDTDDNVCDDCGCRVAPNALQTFTTPCPVPPCPSYKNPDDGCAFAAVRSSPSACLYCGRTGDRDHEITDDDVLRSAEFEARRDQARADFNAAMDGYDFEDDPED